MDFYEKPSTWMHFCEKCGYVKIFEATFKDILGKCLRCPECGESTVRGLCSVPTGALIVRNEVVM